MTETAPILHRVETGAATLAVHEWHAELRGEGPSLVLVHATGFHARCWDAVIAAMGARHVLAVDQRGHGQSPRAPYTDWRDFGADLIAVYDAFELEGALAVGHSMGGAVTIMTAAARPERIARALLIDPVVMPPAFYAAGQNPVAAPEGELHPVARRRARFDSVADMQERLGAKLPYSIFDPRVMEDYCHYGTREEGGARVLRCDPDFEASVYERVLEWDGIHATAASLTQPVTVVRTMQVQSPRDLVDFRYSPTWPELAGTMAAGRDLLMAHRTHFLPQEDPHLAAGLILGALA